MAVGGRRPGRVQEKLMVLTLIYYGKEPARDVIQQQFNKKYPYVSFRSVLKSLVVKGLVVPGTSGQLCLTEAGLVVIYETKI